MHLHCRTVIGQDDPAVAVHEGLMVDHATSLYAPSLANLKGIVEYFFRRYFDDAALDVRFTASYFPFVEPGVEVHVKGTRGKLAGRWLEVAGAGMVHQNVFENVGYARGEMQGFAFGAALERLVMLKHGVNDIRLFQSGDLQTLLSEKGVASSKAHASA